MTHLIDGEFQSDKYDWCKPGFVPLKLTDPMAQPVLAMYAAAHRSVDAGFSDDLVEGLRLKGYFGKDDAIVPAQHPIDRALGALDEAVALLLTSGKPTRFAEINTLTSLAHQLQCLRPAAGVDDVGGMDDGGGVGVGVMWNPVANGMNVGMPRRFNDGADLNREIIMLAQGFLKSYTEAEKLKAERQASRPSPDVRIDTVAELADLMALRLKLMLDSTEPVPEEITRRIDTLLKAIGEPAHAPESRPDPVVPAEPLRGYTPDGPGPVDGDRVGEPVAQ